MAAHPDAELVRSGYDAFVRGDMETLGGLMTVDCVHHVPGTHPLAGHHKGRDNILNGYYRRMGEETGGTMRVELDNVMVDGRGHAISTHHYTAERMGRTIDERGALFFTIVGGKISDIDECVDDIEAGNRFWS
ncbi:MAG: nuclear transport factor 2 family protein [Streptomycetaceae bacterium]|nr:nuclear transport factor 2 family protein [Streptomycetaceae bacterium]